MRTNEKAPCRSWGMSSNDDAMEVALLVIAKDLLQASDDLAPTDPSASAKLAHEAYEIGRDLGIVRNHLDDEELPNGSTSPVRDAETSVFNGIDTASEVRDGDNTSYRRRDIEDDVDADLFRILDRQKAMLPKAVDMQPARQPSLNTRSLTFESAPTRRSGWFGWIRSREWRHAG